MHRPARPPDRPSAGPAGTHRPRSLAYGHQRPSRPYRSCASRTHHGPAVVRDTQPRAPRPPPRRRRAAPARGRGPPAPAATPRRTPPGPSSRRTARPAPRRRERQGRRPAAAPSRAASRAVGPAVRRHPHGILPRRQHGCQRLLSVARRERLRQQRERPYGAVRGQELQCRGVHPGSAGSASVSSAGGRPGSGGRGGGGGSGGRMSRAAYASSARTPREDGPAAASPPTSVTLPAARTGGAAHLQLVEQPPLPASPQQQQHEGVLVQQPRHLVAQGAPYAGSGPMPRSCTPAPDRRCPEAVRSRRRPRPPPGAAACRGPAARRCARTVRRHVQEPVPFLVGQLLQQHVAAVRRRSRS